MDDLGLSKTLSATRQAIAWAAGVGFSLLLFFSTIFLVTGDGQAPWITDAAIWTIEWTRGLAHLEHGGSAFSAAGFWALVVFTLVFIFRLIRPSKR
jgi:hypothetical protein